LPEPTAETDTTKSLTALPRGAYGKDYSDHLLRLYELYEKSAHGISDRRQIANSYYLTICTTIVGFLSLFELDRPADLLMVAAGLAICVVWLRAIRSYRDINAAKFRVLHEMEEMLPLRPYVREWELLEEGKNPKRYAPFSKVEGLIPWVFIALFLGVAILGGGVGELLFGIASSWVCGSVVP
jgi:hypothetical protein